MVYGSNFCRAMQTLYLHSRNLRSEGLAEYNILLQISQLHNYIYYQRFSKFDFPTNRILIRVYPKATFCKILVYVRYNTAVNIQRFTTGCNTKPDGSSNTVCIQYVL